MNAVAMWPGPNAAEARAAYERCRTAGMSPGRALVIACVASFRQGWAFRRTLANHTGVCIRTVQRALTQGKDLGLLGTARAKPNEIPPGMHAPLKCGWSHRWIVGWGLALAAAKAAVEKAWLRRLQTVSVGRQPPRQPPKHGRGPCARKWTAQEIDAELERLTQGPPKQHPPGS